MNTEIPKKLKMQSLLAKITIVLGLTFLIFMIVVEGEPGAITLALISTGSFWYFLIRSKIGPLKS
ncbi:MAG: hypothetical protein RI564_01525 [Gracilimonas sp.]|nr:hypothetical protein [Gracilimonas sp.]